MIIVISTLFELTELVDILPTPNIFFMSCSNCSSTSVLFIIVVFAVVVVVVTFVILYPLFDKAFFTFVAVASEPEPFNISIFIAQYWGQQDLKGIRKTFGIMLITCLGVAQQCSAYARNRG